jgi:hypothetical protein
VELVSRYAGPAAIHTSRRLLLSLLPREEPGKLRENVRAAEVCVALVGNYVREIEKPL